MLWTDGVFIATSDLTRIDSEVVRVAAAEDIALDGVNGLLRGVVEEVSHEMTKMVIAFGGYLNSGDLSANHMAAVLNVGIGNSVRQKIGLQQIVVSGDVPGQWGWIKQWVVFWALKIFYRNAFARVGGDRYKDKMEFYRDEIQRRVVGNLWSLGVPMVIRPLSRPAALFDQNSGSWGGDNVMLVPGSGTMTSDDSCDVAISYVDMSQANFYVDSSHRNNAESHPSEVVTQAMEADKVLSVNISSLNPPSGAEHPSQLLVVVISPLKATHWNVYVGHSGGTLYLQNSAPIPISTTSYTLGGDPTFSAPTSQIGQYCDRRLSLLPTRQRA